MAVSGRAAAAAVLSVAILALAAPHAALGDALSIYTVQFTTDPAGGSDYAGQVIDCVGGIVVGKYAGFRPRVFLQDPAEVNGWGGIQVKDWTNGDFFDQVELGDWVELSKVLVEEFRGTTLLQWQSPHNPGFNILSRGNPLPPPIIVDAADVPAPLEQVDGWFVADHAAERFESMRVVVRNVWVTRMDLGKALDNYNVQNSDADECWASDYMNEDVGPWGYHDFVTVGRHFGALSGLVEQYTLLPDGWDYYQIVTLRTIDLAISGDGNGDGLVDALDVQRLADCLTGPQCDGLPGGCDPPAWTSDPPGLFVQDCLMMDFSYDGDVDLRDVAEFQVVFGLP